MALMDTAWRCRLMIFGVVSLLLVGDLFGYGGYSVRGVKSDHPDEVVGVQARGGSPTGPAAAGKFQQKNAEIEIGEGEWHFQVVFLVFNFLCNSVEILCGVSFFLSFCLSSFFFYFLFCHSQGTLYTLGASYCKISITFACLYKVSLCLVVSRSISIYKRRQGAAKALQNLRATRVIEL